jgi:hypothetical protein
MPHRAPIKAEPQRAMKNVDDIEHNTFDDFSDIRPARPCGRRNNDGRTDAQTKIPEMIQSKAWGL